MADKWKKLSSSGSAANQQLTRAISSDKPDLPPNPFDRASTGSAEPYVNPLDADPGSEVSGPSDYATKVGPSEKPKAGGADKRGAFAQSRRKSSALGTMVFGEGEMAEKVDAAAAEGKRLTIASMKASVQALKDIDQGGIGLAYCNCCERYGPWDDEVLKTDLTAYTPPKWLKYGDKMGKRMDRGGEPKPDELPPTWWGKVLG